MCVPKTSPFQSQRLEKPPRWMPLWTPILIRINNLTCRFASCGLRSLRSLGFCRSLDTSELPTRQALPVTFKARTMSRIEVRTVEWYLEKPQDIWNWMPLKSPVALIDGTSAFKKRMRCIRNESTTFAATIVIHTSLWRWTRWNFHITESFINGIWWNYAFWCSFREDLCRMEPFYRSSCRLPFSCWLSTWRRDEIILSIPEYYLLWFRSKGFI